MDENMKKLEKNYLDPDSARKVGTLKQQYALNKNKRDKLTNNIRQNASRQSKTHSMQIMPSRYRVD